MAELRITSEAFADGEAIPARFTCQGENINPPLTIEGVPDEAKSLVLAVDDPDIPQEVKDSMGIDVFDRWVLFNIPPSTSVIEEDAAPKGTHGVNSGGENNYTGPCPPAEYEPTEHSYRFQLMALDTTLDLPAGSSKDEVLEAARGHVIAEGMLVGTYEKH